MFIDLSLSWEKPELENVDKRDADLFRSGHYGTHLDKHREAAIPLEYCRSRALLFDVSAVSRQRPLEIGDAPLEMIEKRDFVLFRTGALQRNPYASKEYSSEFLEFSWSLLDALVERGIRFIGLDARGLRRGEEHRKADLLCEESGTYVVENVAGLERLPEREPFLIYAAWFAMGGSGLPCKLVAETA